MGEHARQPIDLFFNSLADDRGDHAIGIVLSGSGSDGTLGIKAIKERGGLTLAQGSDHSAPRHTGMPSSAIGTGLVDLIVPVEAMGEKLVAYVDSFVATTTLVGGVTGRTAEERAEAARREICTILRGQVGHDFTGYKEKTFLRRVQRRMQVVQLVELPAYIDRLRHDREEVNLLFRDLLIGVTAFFRDSEAFAALDTDVIPKLLEAGKRKRVRARLGSRLRNRRGGLFDRDPAARAHGRIGQGTQGAGVRHRHRRGGSGHRPGRTIPVQCTRGGLTGAPAALLHRGGRHVPACQGGARAVHLLAPQPGP